MNTHSGSIEEARLLASTRLSYAKLSGSSRVSVNAKTGAVSVKKGTKRGTYKIRFKASAVKSSRYQAATATYTLTIRVI
ncbi:MAG: hypothetical protein ACI36W_02120 [Coriobacteriales bacterium]